MFTRNLNERIFFIEYKKEKDQNGDLIKKEKERFFCWAEVAKATTKEFRNRSTDKIDELKKRRNKRTFYIRFRKEIEDEKYIKWRDRVYRIIDIEEDWQSKDMLMITVEEVK